MSKRERWVKMKQVSILNNVIGPVMRGPSSSHTAGPWRIGKLAVDLLGDKPKSATFFIDPKSSLAVCYHDQGSDLALVSGILGKDLTNPDFFNALKLAPKEGLTVSFKLESFPEADHPNSIFVILEGHGGSMVRMHAKSIGGGSIEITSVDDLPVLIKGDSHEVLVEMAPNSSGTDASTILSKWAQKLKNIKKQDKSALHGSSPSAPPKELLEELKGSPEVERLRYARPVMFPIAGKEMFKDLKTLLDLANENNWTLGDAALFYEHNILQISIDTLNEEMKKRLHIMLNAVKEGLNPEKISMRLLKPTAQKIMTAIESDGVFLGGTHLKAASRAMAAMHVSSSGGVVCAAPTGGSAGLIPGVMATLMEDMGLSEDDAVRSLWAAGAVGLLLDQRSTFAAEVAGCQVEIGAAGAMAAAAVVEAAKGSAGQACDAAAILFQNVMGSVCDLIQGIVEIPCHTRNAALASQAFLCADLILGGYQNPVPLDETIDAVDSVGRMLPEELRCTSRGGIAICPSALALPRLDLQKQ
ncbi:MAG: L-serine dehydratase [Thermovirga sp.]|jgi:L-serine dehydratase|nr:L-serine dehydratase [Thermovirga sp.]MDN5367526.1 L-serine dehydratase [Thermovirga sp.]